MTMKKAPKLMLLDLETTGLDPQVDVILEIAMCDFTLPVTREYAFERVINHRVLPPMNGFVTEMHSRNGLFAEVALAKDPIFVVEADALNWLEAEEGFLIAVGNSVHFDLAFLRAQMPALWSRFSHRIYDMGSVGRFIEQLGLAKPRVGHADGEIEHRALGDIQRCAREARAYTDMISDVLAQTVH